MRCNKFYLVLLFSCCIISFVAVSCNPNGDMVKQEKRMNEDVHTPDEIQMLPGLWSLDSMNFLTNAGYYFMPDGSVDRIASTVSGTWEFRGPDSLIVAFPVNQDSLERFAFTIDTLVSGRMILNDADKSLVFRKVPFGLKEEGTVLSGFSGSIIQGFTKEYSFDLASARKMEVLMTTKNPGIAFRMYDDIGEVTDSAVTSWKGILVRGGKYRIRIGLSAGGSIGNENADFTLKVTGY